MDALGNLTATDLSRPGEALSTAFTLLNMYRTQSGIDNYGQVSTCQAVRVVVTGRRDLITACIL